MKKKEKKREDINCQKLLETSRLSSLLFFYFYFLLLSSSVGRSVDRAPGVETRLGEKRIHSSEMNPRAIVKVRKILLFFLFPSSSPPLFDST